MALPIPTHIFPDRSVCTDALKTRHVLRLSCVFQWYVPVSTICHHVDGLLDVQDILDASLCLCGHAYSVHSVPVNLPTTPVQLPQKGGCATSGCDGFRPVVRQYHDSDRLISFLTDLLLGFNWHGGDTSVVLRVRSRLVGARENANSESSHSVSSRVHIRPLTSTRLIHCDVKFLPSCRPSFRSGCRSIYGTMGTTYYVGSSWFKHE